MFLYVSALLVPYFFSGCSVAAVSRKPTCIIHLACAPTPMCRQLIENKDKIVLAQASSAYKHALQVQGWTCRLGAAGAWGAWSAQNACSHLLQKRLQALRSGEGTMRLAEHAVPVSQSHIMLRMAEARGGYSCGIRCTGCMGFIRDTLKSLLPRVRGSC